MTDDALKNQLKRAFDAAEDTAAPPFGDVWHAATLQHRRERRRYAILSGVAAALAIAVIGLWSYRQVPVSDEFLIADALLNQTQWSAPSDVLLPEHEYDIYQEVPFLVEPTNPNEGLFL